MKNSNSSGDSGQESTSQVHDHRRHDFFIVDNEVVDHLVEQIEPKRRSDAGWIYTILCRQVNNYSRQSRVKINYLIQKTGRSKPTVIDAIKALKTVGLIDVTRNYDGQGHQMAPTYTLLQVSKVKLVNPRAKVQSKNYDGPELTDLTASNKDSVLKTNSGSSLHSEPSSEDGRAVPLEKYITDMLYEALQENNLPEWDGKQYGFHVSRVKRMVEKNNPTDEEIEQLPAAFIERLAYNSTADAIDALTDIRREKLRQQNEEKKLQERQQRRQERSEEYSGPAPWERPEPTREEIERWKKIREEQDRKELEVIRMEYPDE